MSPSPPESVSCSQPNIVFILVDELRFPMHFPEGVEDADHFIRAYMPNLYRIWHKGVKFSQYYTAASDCTPGRGTIVTGLYAQQTYTVLTRANPNNPQGATAPQPALNPIFPTYGKLLREVGYDTPYIGKWHLSDFPLSPTSSAAPDYLNPYGFQGLSIPDPLALPGQGIGATSSTFSPVGSNLPFSDTQIAAQAVSWLQNRAQAQNEKPFCLTVGFLNPHDKQFFWGGIEVNEFNQAYQAVGESPYLNLTTQVVEEVNPPSYGYPPVPSNWESEASLSDPEHPRFHLVFQQAFQYMVGGFSDDPSATTFCAAPTQVVKGQSKIVAPYAYWQKGLDLYTQMISAVDKQIGQVIENIPEAFRQNTVIVFSSDHGEYAASHGLQGKGGSVYEESYRVPLVVMDPRPAEFCLTAAVHQMRQQLVSSVDLLPLLVSIGNGGSTDWITGDYAALYGNRADLLEILKNPAAPGREYVVYSTDELIPKAWNFRDAPEHVIGVVSQSGKLGVYSYWQVGTSTPLRKKQEVEYYDYTQGDYDELHSVPREPAARKLYKQLIDDLLPNELQAPLPPRYQNAQAAALKQYWGYVALADSQSAATSRQTTIMAPL